MRFNGIVAVLEVALFVLLLWMVAVVFSSGISGSGVEYTGTANSYYTVSDSTHTWGAWGW